MEPEISSPYLQVTAIRPYPEPTPSQWNSSRSQELRDEFHWDTFDHPPYSPDLAPSDFHLFLKMKEHLAGKRHADDEDLQHAVVDWLNSQAAVWYEEGISKLVSRYY